MPKIATVKLWNIKEKLPRNGAWIVCLTEQLEWKVVVYDDNGLARNQEDNSLVVFSEWCYLGDLDRAKKVKKGQDYG